MTRGGRPVPMLEAVPPPGDEDFLSRAGAPMEPLTETGNAERFARHHGRDVRLVTEWSRWLIWTGQRWEEDPGEILLQARIKESHRRLYETAGRCDDDDKLRAQIAKWAHTSEKRTSREATAKLARSEPGIAISHDNLDANPLLLSVANGTVDLGTGKLQPARREDLITHQVPIPYLPGSVCPRWERFLLEVLPDAATVAYVQRAVGYSLTGLVREHCLFVLWGAGANGKSTLLGVLLELLGPYATQAPAEILLARPNKDHPTELTVLHGRRLVVAQETDDNRRWAEATVKQLTGGDRLIARRMREDFWEFSPTHKLWMGTNHRPAVRGTDEGIWRRIKLIPFERVIPPEQRNHALTEELRAELPGILRWAVDGCLAWQREGLGEPAAVSGAVAEYRTAEDRLAPFLDERCLLDPEETIARAALRHSYEGWAEANSEKPLGAREFIAQLRLRGLTETKVRDANGRPVRGWRGITLRGQ
jgi:putative DNA primase/helicase